MPKTVQINSVNVTISTTLSAEEAEDLGLITTHEVSEDVAREIIEADVDVLKIEHLPAGNGEAH